MTSPDNNRQPLIPMILAAGLIAAPVLAMAQTGTAPATPPTASAPSTPPPARAATTSPATSAPVTPPTASAAATTRQALVPLFTGTGASTVMLRPRLSQLIGSHVYNENDEKIGEVEDILLFPASGLPSAVMGTTPAPASAPASTAPAAPGMSYPLAVVQVGGFLGMGGRLVTVSMGDLRWNLTSERIVMPGATKEILQRRAAFEYSMLRPR
ncbi:PRC-barrel domain-containing protein [Neoroseomonas oryzicola]|uniref:PRC-barrel domain-containing protein n=1 Tax=Neoroseomonas oryzicola TaxID=535904 RepID=A0A9X9WQV0_9PROT|nr:PRC-barrel domain-containing protein [Neoroseomonas oryzicola]MBR0662710.1 hypothetical protein [Neoroseomonas oryzicola]NKE20336.1 hypothetical protein [Neoroseomonas oryzicola]